MILLYNLGEDRLINSKKQKLKIPFNIGVILDNQNYESIFYNLLKLINWNLKVGINFINIFDPFNKLTNYNYEHFKNLLSVLYSKKLNNTKEYKNINDIKLRDVILIKNKEGYNVTLNNSFDFQKFFFEDDITDYSISDLDKKLLYIEEDNRSLKNMKENLSVEMNLFIEKIKLNKSGFFIINIIGYKECNLNIFDLKNIKNYENDIHLGLVNFNLFDREKKNYKIITDDKNNLKKFLTKKEVNYLPECIINFANTELCLYGFPITLIENSEIL